MQKTVQLNWKIQNVKTELAEAKAHYAYSVQNPFNLPKSMDTHIVKSQTSSQLPVQSSGIKGKHLYSKCA